MNKKSWIVFMIIVGMVIAGMIYMSTQDRLDVSNITEESMNKIIGAEKRNSNIADHTYGNKNAKVTVIEYADYQCPGCSTAAPKAKSAVEKYKDNTLLIFRNFPIASSHPNARVVAAVVAAPAAARALGISAVYARPAKEQELTPSRTTHTRVNQRVASDGMGRW